MGQIPPTFRVPIVLKKCCRVGLSVAIGLIGFCSLMRMDDDVSASFTCRKFDKGVAELGQTG